MAVAELDVTLAIGDYDHVRDFASGAVRAKGLAVRFLHLPVEEIFHRFIAHREWEVSELSLAKTAALLSQGDPSLVALPVFPSRAFRQSAFFVRRGGGIEGIQDLRGRRVGVPEWAQTAGIYARGYLVDQVGLRLSEIEWVQAGVRQAGREEKVELRLPGGVRLSRVVDRSLAEMLLSGAVDAVVSARPPEGEGIVQLLSSPRGAEEAYLSETGIFPIMHVVALRRDFFERAPWAAMNLLSAFEEAKQRSLARALDPTVSSFPLPWIHDHALACQALLGADPFPYGVEANRRTLEAFLRYAHEQGVCQRHLAVEELFPQQVQERVRV